MDNARWVELVDDANARIVAGNFTENDELISKLSNDRSRYLQAAQDLQKGFDALSSQQDAMLQSLESANAQIRDRDELLNEWTKVQDRLTTRIEELVRNFLLVHAIRDGSAVKGRWIDEDGNCAMDGYTEDNPPPSPSNASWEPYTLEEQRAWLDTVVEHCDKILDKEKAA